MFLPHRHGSRPVGALEDLVFRDRACCRPFPGRILPSTSASGTPGAAGGPGGARGCSAPRALRIQPPCLVTLLAYVFPGRGDHGRRTKALRRPRPGKLMNPALFWALPSTRFHRILYPAVACDRPGKGTTGFLRRLGLNMRANYGSHQHRLRRRERRYARGARGQSCMLEPGITGIVVHRDS